MKRSNKRSLWSDVSVLIIATLVVNTFLRGMLQFWAFVAVYAVWSVSAIRRHLIPYWEEKKAKIEARMLRRRYEQLQKLRKEASMQERDVDVDISEPVSIVLLRHVNHRISAYLQSTYPDATWEWCCADPERVVTRGGTERIRLHGVEDYNYAEISLDQNAEISCQLLKFVPFAPENTAPGEKPEQALLKPRETDPQVWYEKKGKAVLTNLIADLNSRGHSTLTIQEDGSIMIQQAGKETKRSAFEAMPERVYWPRLVKVFEREGIASDITAKGLVLSW